MKKLKYNAWLIWSLSAKCNLNCYYCTANADKTKNKIQENITDIKSIVKTLNNTGKIFRITISGGEPFLVSNIIELMEELTKKHYIAVITNLTSNKIKDFVKRINPGRVIEIKGSLHLDELEKHDLVETFIENYYLIKNHGYYVFVKEVGYPYIIDKINYYKKKFSNLGIDVTFDPFVGIWNGKKYPESYTEEEIRILNLKDDYTYSKDMYNPKGKLCNAGYNTVICRSDGKINPCFFIKKNQGFLTNEINFNKEYIKCPKDYCTCPVYLWDPLLYQKGFEEQKIIKSEKKNNLKISYNKENPSTKIKYCHIKDNKSTADKFVNNFTGINEWINIFNGKIKNIRTIFNDLKDGKFDIIQFNFSIENLYVISRVKEILGKNSKTKIAVSFNMNVENLKTELLKIEQIKNTLNNIDFIYCSNYFLQQFLSSILNKTVYCFPNPVNTNYLKSIKIKNNKNFITTIFDENNSYIPYIGTTGVDLKKRLIEYDKIKDKNTTITYSLYDEIYLADKKSDIFSLLNDTAIIIDQESNHTSGEYIVIPAILGIPVVGSNRIESVKRCFPHTSIKPYDTEKNNKFVKNLINNKRFKDLVINTARENAEYYNYENSKYRYLENLYNETKDKRFSHENNENIINCSIDCNFKIKHEYGEENIKYNIDEFVVICLIKNEEFYIEYFIEYYQKLGAKHIFFIDNGSTDNSLKIIKNHKNVSIYSTNLSFKLYENDIRNNIIKKLCKNRWCLYVDIDEFFDYPYSDKIIMNQLLDYLNKNNFTAVVANILDMFPKEPITDYSKHNFKNIISKHCFYDICNIEKNDYPLNLPYCMNNISTNNNIKFYTGGVRKEYFGGVSGYYLIKHPLLFIDDNIEPYTQPHFCDKAILADISCLIKHYKFTPNILKKCNEIINQNNYPVFSYEEYKALNKKIQNNKNFTLFSKKSQKLNSINDLINNDFLVISNNYEKYTRVKD